MVRKRSLFLSILLFGLAACLPLPATPAPPTTEPSPPSLTVQALRNGSYRVLFPDNSTHTLSLSDGVYQSGTDPSATDFVLARLGEPIAFGDLDGDGSDDAVLPLTLNFGGSGMFTALIPVLNRDGAAWQPSPAPLEDLPLIHTLTITNGEIFLSATIHGLNDPTCCPSQPVTKTYRLLADKLWLTHLTSRASANAAERAITIESPAENAKVTNPVTITGNVTIAPFENALLYKIRTSEGEVIEQGPLMVDAPDLGAPGVFTLTFDLSASGYHGAILVELWDLSPADGSPLAMDAVYLLLQ